MVDNFEKLALSLPPSTLKPQNVPGPDAICADVIKFNPDWWAPVLSFIFTMIDRTGIIPLTEQSVIVPCLQERGAYIPRKPSAYL